ncbi:YdgA family protein [Microbulbifer sp. EKSA008]|uniref:YdgA family protein n=1 Tax=unclassified Microbulbifer TaxID=2619833 RepID=UPI00403A48D5
MKKVLSVLLPAAVLTGIVGPKIVGAQLESSIDEILATANKNSAYTVEVKNMDSSWFSTQATFLVSMDVNAFADIPVTSELESFSVEVDFSASHGPFRFGEHAGFGWLGWTLEVAGDQLREHLVWAEEAPFYQVHGNMKALGSYYYNDSITPFTTDVEDQKTQLTFSGFQGRGQYQDEQLTYQGSADSLTVTSELRDFKVERLTMDMTMPSSLEAMFESTFYDSDTTINFGAVKLNDREQNENIDIADLYIKASTELNPENQLGNMQVAYGTKKVDIAEFHGEDLALELEVTNISQEFLKSYQDFAVSLNKLPTEEATTKTMEFMSENLLSLVAGEPQLNITSLRGTFPQGSFNSNLHTSLVGISALPEQPLDPAFWLSHTLVDGELSGDKAVIEFIAVQVMKAQLKNNPQTQGMSEEQLEQIAAQQVPTILASLEQQGLLVSTNDGYISNVSLKDSELKVNEKPMPLPL